MTRPVSVLVRAVLVALALAFAAPAFAHCDTIEGPVVADARTALDTGRTDPVLKWVDPASEAEVHDAFTRALKVRALSPEARDVADRYFFETVVRLHRAREGEPYTGLKPGTAVEPIVVAADAALASGDGTALVEDLESGLEAELRARLERAVAARAHKDESVDAGREFVEAYVSYVHYVEGVEVATAGTQIGHGAAVHDD
ncbi:MAG: DUF6448 family protein [Pseudomonadota bacterium]|nr:DUF6448 family protein [Pseudomonadota bacterium]